jgi:hypothetical protein
MTARRTLRILVATAVPGVFALAALPGEAGNYRPAPSYSAPSYSSAGKGVYGFGSNGQSFVYKPAPSIGTYGASTSSTGAGIYGPQYRLDALTTPRTKAMTTPLYNPQPHYFSGRMWYPRGY